MYASEISRRPQNFIKSPTLFEITLQCQVGDLEIYMNLSEYLNFKKNYHTLLFDFLWGK